jgi:hypothetical protein
MVGVVGGFGYAPGVNGGTGVGGGTGVNPDEVGYGVGVAPAWVTSGVAAGGTLVAGTLVAGSGEAVTTTRPGLRVCVVVGVGPPDLQPESARANITPASRTHTRTVPSAQDLPVECRFIEPSPPYCNPQS